MQSHWNESSESKLKQENSAKLTRCKHILGQDLVCVNPPTVVTNDVSGHQ